MDIETFAREVEDAADCYGWGPSVLRKWLQTRASVTLFERGLAELADGRGVDSARETMRRFAGSEPKNDLPLYEAAVELVHDGATPNAIRARLSKAAEREGNSTREAA